ncbi:hypothetical protein D0Q02_08805 [Micromonospora craniellae]|uniref:Sortase n=1 Tax=Micromonospora craniellae TaxID=2294034 RepID=A0A372G292_9ACTN|nr:hypothetical protein [Micromonospora craniellae]QOC92723.1 hypothetical protein ID554_02900 [Micromonospora craniellae]RFS46869.1 hypothetical protein D0Q02_08805 [Micromonospora craniellae]
MTRTRRATSAAGPALLLCAAVPLVAAVLVAPVLQAGPARAAGPPAVLAAPQPGPNVFVEVMPSTVEPGHIVGLRASCQDNSVGAIVVSDAFGRVAVQPQRGLLFGTAMVKDRVLPGNYRVKLECRGGETASTMLQVVRTMKPSRGPATGFGGGAGGVAADLLLPGGLALTVAGMVVWAAARRRGTGG